MSTSRKLNASLWTAQTLLAMLFLFAGGFKLITPAAEMAKLTPLPVAFIQFIGICETLGALGLILPGLTRVHTELTSLAAAGLVIIMIGAVVVTVVTAPVAAASLPFVTGCVAAFVAWGRSRISPLGSSRVRDHIGRTGSKQAVA